jgi:predicted dehydrogenase
MSRTTTIGTLGRRIRLGVVGGGAGSLIGPVHRIAARLDDCFEICAGVLSSSPQRSLDMAISLGIPRGYPDVAAMLGGEAAHRDGIEAVAIMTPNDSHCEIASLALKSGLDVICDKPLANDYELGVALAREAEARGRVLCLTHNYSGYPMIREARAAIAASEIGPLRVVRVSYVQGSLSKRVEADPDSLSDRLRWRLDEARGGRSHVMYDIGVHAHQLLSFVTGQRISAVLADVGAALPDRTAHDTAGVIFRLEEGARGTMLVTKAASGAQNAISIEAYGEDGGILWSQAAPNDLRVMRLNKADEVRTSGLPSLHPHAQRGVRLPIGHPEAFFEAFANIYTDFADLVAARLTGTAPDPLAALAPNGWTGVDGLAFIDACLTSTKTGTWCKVRQST